MGRMRRGVRRWHRPLVAVATGAIAIVGIVAQPALAGTRPSHVADVGAIRSAPRTASVGGSGTASVLPASVVAPTPTSLNFTYTASATLTSGSVSVAVPAGWTVPTTSNTTASTGVVSVVGSTITVSGVSLTSAQTLAVTYGAGADKVTPAPTGGFDTFTVSMTPTSSGTPAALSMSPSVYVYAKASPALFKDVTMVPPAVFNYVGITSHRIMVAPPSIDRHQPAFVTRVHGVRVPASFYEGAGWCPYCASNTWATIVALARFGHFNQFYEMTSSPSDFAPNTPSFTFYMSSYASPFLSFTGYEVQGPTLGQTLETPPKFIQALFQKYDPQEGWPFMDVGNLTIVYGANFDPAAISKLNDTYIASHLRVGTNPFTRAIVASANYLSAGICASDGEKPATVCKSVGVTKADAALGLRKP
jgi:hypothetical protein